MAIRKIEKSPQGANVANANSPNNGVLKRSAIFPIDNTNGKINKTELGVFLINPSTWEDSKTANWNHTVIPGQSDPVLQWTSSGPRVVTFEALVTADNSEFNLYRTVDSPSKSVLMAVADIASNFFRVSIPTPRTELSTDDIRTKLDISKRLEFYRSLLYPEYGVIAGDKSERRRLLSSPPLVTLWNGSSLSRKTHGDFINEFSTVWVVTNLKIRITKQLPNLAPMEAVVTFELVQYAIKPFSRGAFLDSIE